MYRKINSNPNIYAMFIPLPNNPLKSLNCYVVKTKERNLIIDTGFNMPECYEVLVNGLKELEIDIDKTDLFLTHLHADHTGLASAIMKDDSTIYMSRTDYEYILRNLNNEYWESMDISYLMEGFGEEELRKIRSVNPSKVFNITKIFDAVIQNSISVNMNSHVYLRLVTHRDICAFIWKRKKYCFRATIYCLTYHQTLQDGRM